MDKDLASLLCVSAGLFVAYLKRKESPNLMVMLLMYLAGVGGAKMGDDWVLIDWRWLVVNAGCLVIAVYLTTKRGWK